MKVLFVCQANVGRSQTAMEFYRKAHGNADSAGTKVDTPGTTLSQRPGAVTIMNIMSHDYAIEMIHNVRIQITQELASHYDALVVMAETDTVPEWLQNDDRAVFWKIDDPKGQDGPTTRRIVLEVKARVDALIEQYVR